MDNIFINGQEYSISESGTLAIAKVDESFGTANEKCVSFRYLGRGWVRVTGYGGASATTRAGDFDYLLDVAVKRLEK